MVSSLFLEKRKGKSFLANPQEGILVQYACLYLLLTMGILILVGSLMDVNIVRPFVDNMHVYCSDKSVLYTCSVACVQLEKKF